MPSRMAEVLAWACRAYLPAAFTPTLGAVVAHVLVHEIGHHFGLSDDDMAAIEAKAG